MKIDRALRERESLISRIRDAYSSANCFHPTSADLHKRVRDAIAKLPPKTPQWVRGYADGYARALKDQLYRESLVFGGFVGGVFMSTHSNRPDYYGKQGVEPSAFADDGLVKNRGHYWAKDTSRPFFIG